MVEITNNKVNADIPYGLNLNGCDNYIDCKDDNLTNISSIQGVVINLDNESMYDIASSNKREMENELKEMEILIATKNFSFETIMIEHQLGFFMEKLCLQIHNMKWITTTGMSKDDYENTLCVKYDLPEPDKDLMISVGCVND